MEVTNLPISSLHIKGNVRRDPDLELVESIRAYGVKEPLRVYKNNTGWIVQNGSRRLVAAAEAGELDVPCIIVNHPTSTADDIVTQVIVNTTQKPLAYLDKALAMQKLRGEGLSQREIATQLSLSEPEVSQALAVLGAHPKLQKAVEDGRISPSALEPLIPLPYEEQEQLADAAIKERTVRRIGDLVRAHKSRKKASNRVVDETTPDATPAELQAIASIETALLTLSMASGTKIVNSEMRMRGHELVVSLMQAAHSLEAMLAG